MRKLAHTAIGLAALASRAFSAAPLSNPSFEQGDTEPLGWQLEGKGAWEKAGHTGERAVSVTGTGADSSFWRTTELKLEPNTLYRVSFWTRAERATGGCVISGPTFANRDFHPGAAWERHSYAFVAPAETVDAYLRFGQWNVTGKVLFDGVELKPTQAVHERFGGGGAAGAAGAVIHVGAPPGQPGGIVLGEGEEIVGNRYTFAAPLAGEGANHSRPLDFFNCGFNSNRWCFHDKAEVVYKHLIPGRQQNAATLEANCNYHSSGKGFVDVSNDGHDWATIATFEKVGRIKAEVPKNLLPAQFIYVRFRASGKEADTLRSKPGDFQIDDYVYSATLDADLGELRGATAYLDIQVADPAFPVTVLSLPSAAPGSGWTVSIKNQAGAPAKFEMKTSVTDETGRELGKGGGASATGSVSVSISVAGGVGVEVAPAPVADATMQMSIGEPLRHPGTNVVTLTVTADGRVVYKASATRKVSALHDASYGYALPSDPACPLWWCEGPYKVSRSRPVPTVQKPAIELAAPRHDHEPFQLVLRPKAELKNLRIQVSPLKSGEATLAPEHIQIEQVAYLNVVRPTDAAGVRGWWPDPLPPFEQGTNLAPDRNHPLWFTVYVPPDQPAGDYQGTIELSSDGWKASVPLKLHVYDFALPKTTRLQTAFGLDPGVIRRYHNLETTDELRKVLDLYLANFAAHRIAPYSPALLDPLKVEFSTGPWDGGSLDGKDPKEGKRCLRVDDNDPKSSVVAFHTKPIPVDITKTYQLSWWAKTAKPKQQYLVTLQQYDAAGQWISGNNIDFPREGTGQWKQEAVTIPAEGGKPFNAQTKTVRLALRPAPWSDEGDATGTAWFDDVRFTLADGPNLIADGGFEQGAGELKATIDFAAFDRECEKWLGEGGFNALLVGLKGMGGGTFFSRSPGRIGQFVQGTPEYDQLMASQGRQLVEHLRAKGWLDKAYMYWFDEPEPRDYEFVVEGMKLIKRAAPGLTRMLTEQPEPALFGHVDLWCPVVSNFKPEAIAERRKAGERFWWYLCCGPHAPYIGLFIDHPAVDLRVWAWLSRKWGVTGQLVWTSNYWTSPAAFPDPDLQNPWQDPMSYCSGYDFTPGKIGYWGNGDGRFLYPPNREPSTSLGPGPKADKTKHLGGPINSIRWEMLREGIEDYELFCLLDTLIARAKASGKAAALLPEAEKLALVPDAVIRDDQTYSKDPQPLLTHRRKVAEMVEKLGRALR
jgi:hypothetical protein